jgi:hypothetical protein
MIAAQRLGLFIWKFGGLYFFSFNDYAIFHGRLEAEWTQASHFEIELIDNVIKEDAPAAATADLQT